MTHQPLQILVHKSDALSAASKEDIIDLAYVVVDMLVGVQLTSEAWRNLQRNATGVTKRASSRSLARFKVAYREAVKEYKDHNKVPDLESEEGSIDYTGRDLDFEYRIANPSYFLKDSALTPSEEVETPEQETIIEEDSSYYRGREDEFQHRLREPGRFRRGD